MRNLKTASNQTAKTESLILVTLLLVMSTRVGISAHRLLPHCLALTNAGWSPPELTVIRHKKAAYGKRDTGNLQFLHQLGQFCAIRARSVHQHPVDHLLNLCQQRVVTVDNLNGNIPVMMYD